METPQLPQFSEFREPSETGVLLVGLQHVTSLQQLRILGCPNLMSLPEWISNLSSLAKLVIDGFPLI